MSDVTMPSVNGDHEIFVALSTQDRQRETALREEFGRFWGTAGGEPRTVYDAFVSTTPTVGGAILEPVDDGGVRGWWVRPATFEPRRAILFLHGGGYVQGSAQAYRGFVSQIVGRTGVPALVIDYPLAPETKLPAAPTAALQAWDRLVTRGFEAIAIVGDSAGGGLSLVTLAALARRSPSKTPVAGVVFSPWTDLALTGASMTDPAVVDPLISHEYLQACAHEYLGGTNPLNPGASPLFGDLRGLPPLLIQVGTDERLLDDSRRYAARARRAGVRVKLEIWDGMHHVFQLDVAHLESSRAALDRAADFMTAAFNDTSDR